MFTSDENGGGCRPETEMDSSFTIKPNAGVPKFTPRERSPARPVKTDLGHHQVVTAVDDGGHEQREKHPDHLPHDIVADPESREVINRENDVRAHVNEIVHPDQALQRYRAYHHTAPVRNESDKTAAPEPHANIKA